MATAYNFGPYRLDAEAEILFHGAEPVALGQRAVALLRVLVEQAGVPVSKDALIDAAWPGLAVEESNLTVQIAALRRVFADGPAGDARWIETLSRRGYRYVGPAVAIEEDHPATGGKAQPVLMPKLPDKPSIAVLPFTNMSGDPEQGYFADGITDDIIMELSRFSELFVIARNSSFQYKGKSVDVRQIGRELGVRYVLEGSIRRGGDRVRIGAQLIDASTGTHRWAERYLRNLEDIFAVQDEVARTIVAILAAHVNKAEVERTLLKPPATWQAYDNYMRACDAFASYLSFYRVEDLYEARRYLERSLSVDVGYARAYAALSRTHMIAWVNPSDGDYLNPDALDRAYQLASKALQLDPNLPQAHADLGYVLTYKRQHEASLAKFEAAIALNPNFTEWRFALALVYAGEPARATDIVKAHMRLDPYCPPAAPGFLGFAHYMLEDYAEALAPLTDCVSRAPNMRSGHAWLAATYAQIGELKKARKEAVEVLRIEPGWTIEGAARQLAVFKYPRDVEHWLAGLRKAGLPEK